MCVPNHFLRIIFEESVIRNAVTLSVARLANRVPELAAGLSLAAGLVACAVILCR